MRYRLKDTSLPSVKESFCNICLISLALTFTIAVSDKTIKERRRLAMTLSYADFLKLFVKDLARFGCNVLQPYLFLQDLFLNSSS